MNESTPEFALDPTLALEERDRWEATIRREVEQQLRAHLSSLTAASPPFPYWAQAVDHILTNVTHLSSRLRARLLAADPGDVPAPVAASRLSATLATVSFNTYVLRTLEQERIGFKVWVSRRDTEVRTAHQEADGQKRRLSQAFLIGPYPMQYPGDLATAPIGMWISCRCVVIGRTR